MHKNVAATTAKTKVIRGNFRGEAGYLWQGRCELALALRNHGSLLSGPQGCLPEQAAGVQGGSAFPKARKAT